MSFWNSILLNSFYPVEKNAVIAESKAIINKFLDYHPILWKNCGGRADFIF
jgi:hypothetical protein